MGITRLNLYMLIYKITNTINNKSYIGQSSQTFESRYANRWWKTTNSRLLKEDAKIFGHQNFFIEILEKNISSRERLNELEKEYIIKYDSFGPNGYNLTSGGNRCFDVTIETKNKLAVARRGCDFFVLKNQLTGEIVKGINSSEFCRERSLLNNKINEVLNGQRMHHKFWTLPNVQMRYWILENQYGRNEKVFEFQVSKFQKKENISKGLVERILGGHERKGWKVIFFQPLIGYNRRGNLPPFPQTRKGPRFNGIYAQNGTSESPESSA